MTATRLFHTKHSDYSIEYSPFKRDIVREYTDAFRAEGLKVGLYYSLIDWHHPDYPAFLESDKPYKWGNWRRSTPEQWNRFIEFMFAQMRELLTNYGKIDLLWFDGGWERTPEEWKSREFVEMIHSLQPEVVINDRIPGYGDYQTPEQAVPPKPPEGPWETCLTINNSWGYNPSDKDLKSTRSLIHTLCEVAGKGGNLLLNVSPMGDGALPPEQVERLEAIGAWMDRNNEAIVGTDPGLEPWQFYGPSTRRGNRVYLHVLMKPYESVSVRGVKVKHVGDVRPLASTISLKVRKRISAADSLFNHDPDRRTGNCDPRQRARFARDNHRSRFSAIVSLRGSGSRGESPIVMLFRSRSSTPRTLRLVQRRARNHHRRAVGLQYVASKLL